MVRINKSSQLSKRKSYQIATTLHEGAVAIAGEIRLPEQLFETSCKIIGNEFATMVKWIAAGGGVVGHLKSYLAAAGQGVMISSTWDQVHTQPVAIPKNQAGQVSIAVIVFGISQPELEARLIAVFDQLVQCQKSTREENDER